MMCLYFVKKVGIYSDFYTQSRDIFGLPTQPKYYIARNFIFMQLITDVIG